MKIKNKLATVSLVFFVIEVITKVILIIWTIMNATVPYNSIFAPSVTVTIFSIYKVMSIVLGLPWNLFSLILSIISTIIHKDKKSKTLLILNIVLIFVKILLIICAIVFFSTVLYSAYKNNLI